MGQEYNNTSSRRGKHFNWEERLILERMIRKKGKDRIRIKQLASILGRCERSIRRELNRGAVRLRNSDLSEYQTYSADIAQGKARRELEAKGPELKLGADYKLVGEIRKLLAKKYSPDAVIMHYKKLSWPTDTRISTRTLYRYIHEGLLGDARKYLLRGKRRHKKGSKGYKRHNRAKSAMKSISTRPDYIETREEFGHWEIDSIVGAKGKGKQTLMTLLERSGRFIMIEKLPDGTSKSLVKTLDKIERKLGSRQFRKVFKSITCDNGSEFMDSQKMERSCLTRGKRSTIYYAHPYSSWERGSNENANGVVRRFIPGGSDIGCYSKKEIREIQDWVNNYPRRILGGRSANEAIGIHLTA